MLAEFSVFDTASYSIEHLFDSEENENLILGFTVPNNAMGLESYLKNVAADDENANLARTYLVKDKQTGELACYFSLRTGLITMQVADDAFDSIPAIELANFAVNDEYRQKHTEARSIGRYSFEKFVLPIVRCMARYVGVNALYIYALPNDRLIGYYTLMGFSRLPEHQEKFVQMHVKPKYDEGCIFMYQRV